MELGARQVMVAVLLENFIKATEEKTQVKTSSITTHFQALWHMLHKSICLNH
jgi:hypothetical protein